MELATEINRYNPALYVFGIPELAKLICEHMSRRDNARLSRASHQLFRDIRSFVWERVDTIDTIIQKILETSADAYIDEVVLFIVSISIPLLCMMPFSNLTTKTVHLPTSPDLFRLRLYSPYVKELEIPLKPIFDAYSNWDSFLASTRATDLLPNLERLKLTVPQRLYRSTETFGEETLNWIIAFLSRSLLSIQLYPDVAWDANADKAAHVWIGLDFVAELLRRLSEKCHRLSSLMVLAEMPDFRFRQGTIETSQTFLEPSLGFDSVIYRFHNLRKLSTTLFILDPPIFSALGKLPFLEVLSIRGVRRDRSYDQQDLTVDLDVGEDTFPALRYLELSGLSYHTSINICKQKRLTQALHSLRPLVWENRVGENNQDQLLGILAKHNSSIRQLCLPKIPWGWQPFPQSTSHLSQLKLTHLSIPQPWHREFGYELSQLSSAVPRLKSLEFTESSSMFPDRLPLGVLRQIAELLPNLTRLSILIDFSSAKKLEEQDFIPHSPQSPEPFCLGLVGFDGVGAQYEYASEDPTSLVKYTENIAKYLYALWPNIECKATTASNDVKDSANLIGLNELLSQLRNKKCGL